MSVQKLIQIQNAKLNYDFYVFRFAKAAQARRNVTSRRISATLLHNGNRKFEIMSIMSFFINDSTRTPTISLRSCFSEADNAK